LHEYTYYVYFVRMSKSSRTGLTGSRETRRPDARPSAEALPPGLPTTPERRSL
jgi:hypothetical protein